MFVGSSELTGGLPLVGWFGGGAAAAAAAAGTTGSAQNQPIVMI